jgi:hypothetical protein
MITNWLFRVSAGKFAAFDPGSVELNIYTPYFSLSIDTYDQIANELGVLTDQVPCNATKDIVFSFNGFDLHLTPDQYMIKNIDQNEYCHFYGIKSSRSKIEFKKCWIFSVQSLYNPGHNLR